MGNYRLWSVNKDIPFIRAPLPDIIALMNDIWNNMGKLFTVIDSADILFKSIIIFLI